MEGGAVVIISSIVGTAAHTSMRWDRGCIVGIDCINKHWWGADWINIHVVESSGDIGGISKCGLECIGSSGTCIRHNASEFVIVDPAMVVE